MAGGNFILGGLLSGLGRGMEQNYLANREEALARLRDEREQKALIDQEDRGEQREIRKETRKATADEIAAERAVIRDERKLRVAGEETRTTAETKFGYDVQLAKIKASEDRGTAAFKAKLDAGNAAMLEAIKGKNDQESIRLRKELDSGNIKDRITDANGRVILIRNDGKMITTPFTEKEKVDTGDYRSRDRKRGPTPEGFDPNSSSASSNSGDGSPWYSPGAKPAPTERVATAAQVQEAAKAKGWTVDQTKRWMRENGWSLR